MIRMLLLLLLCLPVGLAAQDSVRPDSLSKGRPVHSIGLEAHPGYVFPTRSFFKGDNAAGKAIRTTVAAHLKDACCFAPDTRLGRLYPHAYQGVGLAYNSFFNKAEVGTPVMLYVFQGAPIIRLANRLSIDYEWNFGAAFGWEKYDPVDNPYNVVVGSRINAYLNLGFFLNWQPTPDWRLTAGIDLAHYSNGNTNYPNSGVNTIGARIGVTRSWGETARREPVCEKTPILKKRFCYDLILYGSTRKRGLIFPDHGELIPGRFAVAGLNFNPMYVVNKYFRAGLSLDAQYDESANLMEYLAEGTEGDEMRFYRPPFREQFAVGLSLRAELNMPIFSVNVGIGRNVICKGTDTEVFYQILALKAFITRRLFLHVGYQLSDFKNPNNLMLGLGWRFGQLQK